MSTTHTTAPAGTGPRRVRHQARESVLVMALSAALSGGLAGVLLLLAGLSR